MEVNPFTEVMQWGRSSIYVFLVSWTVALGTGDHAGGEKYDTLLPGIIIESSATNEALIVNISVIPL
jgi:hypothetical protein